MESRAHEASPTRLVVTLGLAGLLSGLAIVSAYEWTRPRIEANHAKALREAVFRVLPGIVGFQRWAQTGGKLQPADKDRAGERAIYAGCDDRGQLIGFAIPAEGAGFQDTIKLLFGYLPEQRSIVGMEVLESRETPGLGDRIYKDQAFLDNFRTLLVDPKIILVKNGTKRAAHEVDSITGATISSQAVVNILNAGVQEWRQRLSGTHTRSCGRMPQPSQSDSNLPSEAVLKMSRAPGDAGAQWRATAVYMGVHEDGEPARNAAQASAVVFKTASQDRR
ncbi:MAG: FMN-binding protein [Gammaproteobacteria bacterium]